MHIAFVSTWDARDPTIWAGTSYHMWRALEAQGIRITHVNPLREYGRAIAKMRQAIYARLAKRAVHRDREASAINGYARQVEAAIEKTDVDLIFSVGTTSIAQLHTDRPIAFWTDATYQSMLDAYKWELPVSNRSHRLGDAWERAALNLASLAIYSSDWAARSAIDFYGADASKVKVVPFGANISEQRSLDGIKRLIARRPVDVCKLLFIGTGWQRKGGDIAVEVAQSLNARGVATELTVLGSDAPHALPAFVKHAGFLDKRTPEGRTRFDDLLGSSHFLILPARAEAFGIVLCEANSYGVPSVATNVGGIPTIVRDKVNGVLVARDDAQAMASRIEQLMRDRAAYERLAVNSFCEYKSRLNWEVAGWAVKSLLQSLVP